MLKNVIFKKVMSVREEKRKPKLSDILKISRGQSKELVLKKLEFLYMDKNLVEEEDANFDMITGYLNGIKKLQ
jgi:hypothetical protein